MFNTQTWQSMSEYQTLVSSVVRKLKRNPVYETALKYLEIIEVTFKSIYTYEFTKVHGATGYLDSSLFSDEAKYREIIKNQKTKNSSKQALLYGSGMSFLLPLCLLP